MYHFTETLSNKSGDVLSGWFAEVVQSGTTTVVPIYADASLTPIVGVSGVANRAKSNTYGEVEFYVSDGNYSVRYYNAAGEYQRTKTDVAMWDISALNDRLVALTTRVAALEAASGGGGGGAYSPSLDLSDSRNSQYLALAF